MSTCQDIMSDPVYSPDRAAGDDEDVDQGHLVTTQADAQQFIP